MLIEICQGGTNGVLTWNWGKEDSGIQRKRDNKDFVKWGFIK